MFVADDIEDEASEPDDGPQGCRRNQHSSQPSTAAIIEAKLYEGLVCNLTEYTAGWTDVEGGLVALKAMVDSAASPADILNYSEGETHNSFIKGASVFARNWPYQWGMIASDGTISQDVVDVAPLPGGSTVGGWLGLYIF